MISFEAKPLEIVIDQNLYFHHFQPIFNVKDLKACGYEGLIRSEHAQNPQILFDTALQSNQLLKLDKNSLFMAIDHLDKHFRYFEENSQFFLNVYPSTLMSAQFTSEIRSFLESKKIPPNQLILELNESENIDDFSTLKKNIKELRDLGVQVALDDIGRGCSPFPRVLELNPQIIKIDKYFSDNLAYSSKKQIVLKGLIDYCNYQGITAILEGLERPEDLNAAKSVGVKRVQGFLLGRPDTLQNHFSMANHF